MRGITHDQFIALGGYQIAWPQHLLGEFAQKRTRNLGHPCFVGEAVAEIADSECEAVGIVRQPAQETGFA